MAGEEAHTATIETTKAYNERRKRIGLSWNEAAERGIDAAEAERKAELLKEVGSGSN